MNFLKASLQINVFEECRKIEISHMLESELPKFSIFIWIHSCMISRMLVSSIVSEPYIISLICQHKSWSFVLVINKEGIRWVKKSMLKNDRLKTCSDLSIFLLNSKHLQNISIFSFHKMLLNWIFVVLAILNEWIFSFCVNTLNCNSQKWNRNYQG